MERYMIEGKNNEFEFRSTKILNLILRGISSGEKAELARMDAFKRDGYTPMAFYRVANMCFPENWYKNDRMSVYYRVLTKSIAMHPVGGQTKLGEALAKAGVSELRLNRLLNSRPGSMDLYKSWIHVLQMIKSKDVGFFWGDAELFLVTVDREKAVRIRDEIASEYCRSINHK
ncbi:MAG: hypothetical protein D6732_05915 [Methanobacteriota archaeon]|nr:MAG: hypothetical protein D6732_05915 [Euryarchaeota archaeon]